MTVRYGTLAWPGVLRRTIECHGRASSSVVVVSAEELVGKLPASKRSVLARALSLFEHCTSGESFDEQASVEFLRCDDPPRDCVLVPGRSGSIPAVCVGSHRRVKVCVPVTPSSGASEQLPFVVPDETTRQRLAEVLPACIEQSLERAVYVAECGLCTRDITRAVETAAELDAVLAQEVDNKLNYATTLPGLHDRALLVGVAGVLRAFGTVFRWCAGAVSDDEWRRVFDETQEHIASIPDVHDHERRLLLESLGLMNSGRERDELSALVPSNAARSYVSRIRVLARLFSHICSEVREHGREFIRFFISHHMDVYASELYYDHLSRYAQKTLYKVDVATGAGRSGHISASILAKLWLCDVQVLYIPNSLATRTAGTEKPLLAREDWVIEELVYGASIEKPLRIVAAEGVERAGGPNERLIEQIRTYDWQSIALFLERDWASACEAVQKALPRHYRGRIRIGHRPGRFLLDPADQENAIRHLLVPALKRRLRAAIRSVARRLGPEHWQLVQVAAELQREWKRAPTLRECRDVAGGEQSFTRVEQIATSMQRTRCKVAAVDIPFISISKRAQNVSVKVSVNGIVNELANRYELSAAKDELRETAWQAMSEGQDGQS